MEALLAAGEVTAKLKGSQAQEQQLVSGFLHHLCEQVHPFRLTLAQFLATKLCISAIVHGERPNRDYCTSPARWRCPLA